MATSVTATDDTPSSSHLIVRSEVPSYSNYLDYKSFLRWDFYFSCAYCTMTESEARGIRFTIDHYEPTSISPELECTYSNLMYACGECNLRKGDLAPPPSARANGFRYFRPDQDWYPDHFSTTVTADGIHLESVSTVGQFTIDGLDLNRQALRRLREIRRELFECEKFVAHGIMNLQSFSIDLLPKQIKGQAQRAIEANVDVLETLASEIDKVLRDYARSPLIDNEPAAASRAAERSKKMKDLQSLFPGQWRSPRRKKASGK